MIAVASIGMLAGARSASAQLTIQQPVFGVNSTATTVSVPDRGRAHLSSVNRAAESRNNFGPFRSGTNTGVFREGSNTSVSVTIHDFDEMDRFLLGQPSSGASVSRSGPRGTDPYQELLARSQRRGQAATDDSGLSPRRGVVGGGTRAASVVAAGSDDSRQPAAGLGAYYLQRGQEADERGAASVARLHYRLAAKHGSAEAAARLASMPASGANLAAGR